MNGEPYLAATRELVLERVRGDSAFVVATHENPDGDALGSLIGMHGLLTALGKDSVMFIAGSDLPLPREYRCAALEHAIQAAPADIGERTVVMLDCGNIDRNPAAVLQHGAHLLNIDHHHDNTLFGTVNLVDSRRLLHRGNRVGPDARARSGADGGHRRGAVYRARDRHGAIHVREHRSPRAPHGGRADRGRA